MIEKTHLMILSAVNRLGTLTEAAETLHLTQPALTHAIRKLEQNTGTQIWQKNGRKIQLTQSGELLLDLAERILPQIEHTETLLKQIALGSRGLLRIGMECHPCYKWLQHILAPFLKKWPEVDVELKQQFQFNGVEALSRHEIDILITPDPVANKELEYLSVFDYEQVLALSKSHALAQCSFVQPQDLTNETLITYPVSTERLDIFTDFFIPAGCRPANLRVIETTDIMLQMVSAGRGITALPDWLIDEYKQNLPLARVKLGKSGIKKSIHIGKRISEQHAEYLLDFISTAGDLRFQP